MSKIGKSASIKLMNHKPAQILKGPRKQRLISHQTIDTATNQRESQVDTMARINEEEVSREIKQVLKVVDGYKGNLLKQKEASTLREQLRRKDMVLQQKAKDIDELNQEIDRLREIYNHPKVKKSQVNPYTKQHLKMFTLAEELQKQRQHLELHIDHHRNLKEKASGLHNNIKDILPRYFDMEKQRGIKPLSYGDFRMKAIVNKRDREERERIKSSLSQRSLGSRSRLSSVRSIMGGIGDVSNEEKSVYDVQRKRSIVKKARVTSKRKHSEQVKDLFQKVNFLRTQDMLLKEKIAELVRQIQLLQRKVISSQSFSLDIKKDNNIKNSE